MTDVHPLCTNETPLVKYGEKYSLLKLAGDFKNLEILEMACGYGYYAIYFAQNGAKCTYGVDIKEEFIDINNLVKNEKNLENVKFIHADPEVMNLEKKFDLICSSFFFDQIPTVQCYQKVCQVMFDHLKPGGKVIIATVPSPNIMSEDYFSYGFQLSLQNDNFPMSEPGSLHINFFDDTGSSTYSITMYRYKYSTLDMAFRQAGFSVQFQHYMIEPEGIKKHGSDFWKRFIDEHPFAIIVAEKPTNANLASSKLAEFITYSEHLCKLLREG